MFLAPQLRLLLHGATATQTTQAGIRARVIDALARTLPARVPATGEVLSRGCSAPFARKETE